MKNMNRLIIFIFISNLWIINSCKKEKVIEVTDIELYDMAKETTGFTWFKKSSSFLDKSSGSG